MQYNKVTSAVKLTLNAGQASCYEAIQSGQNVLMLGGGGVGKSFLIRRIREDFGHETIFMSTTGITALNIGGMTAHRALALPIGFPDTFWLRHTTKAFSKLWRNKKAIKRIVIDEISMCRSDTFTCIDQRLRQIYRNNKPFGGLQVILSGDIFQLPPVVKHGTQEAEMLFAEYGSEFFFKTQSFYEGHFNVVSLTESMRTEDKEMKRHLDAIRFGENLDEAIAFFNQRVVDIPEHHKFTTIVTTNKEVDRGNLRVLRRNPNQAWHYKAMTTGAFRDQDKPVNDELVLKEGLRVMTLVNTPDFSNGSCGTVKQCATDKVVVKMDDGHEVVIGANTWENIEYTSTKKPACEIFTPKEMEDRGLSMYDMIDVVDKETVGRYSQLPLRQCDYITAHKAQGASMDGAIVDFGYGAFAAGQVYTMLSRMTGMTHLYLDRPLYPSDIIVCKEAVEFYRKHAEAK